MSESRGTHGGPEIPGDFELRPGSHEDIVAPVKPDEATGLPVNEDTQDELPVVKAPAPPPKPANVLGEYKLVKKLGQGGMGTVYKAIHQRLQREVAVKVLARELAAKPAFVDRFMREAKVMARLDHPNILRCFDAGIDKGFHYLAIEFVEGGSVETLYKKHGRLSIGDALRIIIDCADALEHAHRQGLIHRDIKPDNLLLTGDGMVKVADLGLAKEVDDDLSLTRTGTGAGTPIYMAPEQARNAKHVDHRADIYALGVMLYAFLAGEPPFQADNLLELITAKERGVFKPLRQHNPEVPARLGLIVDKLLAKDPKHRYQSCAELILELEALGLAESWLSDFTGQAEASKDTVAVTSGGKTKTVRPPSRPENSATKHSTPAPPSDDRALSADVWYLEFERNGHKAVRKMQTAEILMLIDLAKLDETASLAKTPQGPFRSAGTYPKFAKLFKAKIAAQQHSAGKDRFARQLAEFERQAQWSRFNKTLNRCIEKVLGYLGFLIWLAFLAAIGYGLYFVVRHFMMD